MRYQMVGSTVLAALLTFTHASGQEQERPEGAPRSSRLAQGTTEIPMPLVMGRPTIDVTINGQGPFRFILDTGASMLVVFESLAEKIGLEANGKTRIGDPSAPHAVEADTFLIDTLGVGESILKGLYAVSLADMPGLGDIVGIVGLPNLHDMVATLDYPGERMVMSHAPLGMDDDSFPYTLDGGDHIYIDVDVAGLKLGTHIDTGSPGTLSVPLSLADKLTLMAPLVVVGRGRTVSGEFEIHGAQLDGSLTILGVTMKNPQLSFGDRFDWGNLGGGFLQDYALTIDQINRRLRLKKAQGPRRVRRGPSGGGPAGRPR